MNYNFNLFEMIPCVSLKNFSLILILLCCPFVSMCTWYVIFCILLLIFLCLKASSDWLVLKENLTICIYYSFSVVTNIFIVSSTFVFWERGHWLSRYGIYFVTWKICFLFSVIPIIIFKLTTYYLNLFSSDYPYQE